MEDVRRPLAWPTYIADAFSITAEMGSGEDSFTSIGTLRDELGRFVSRPIRLPRGLLDA